MKRLDTLFTITTVGAALCAVAISASAFAATPVKNVTLSKSGDFTEVTIPVPSHQLCDHFTEPATAERPFRIVLNVCNAEHAMPQQNYSNLPACMVQKIRTSQFATAPEAIVRVVLDLKSSATYTVRTESDRLVVAIADACPAFTTWEANTTPVMAKVETPAEPVVEKSVPTVKQEAPKSTPPIMAQNDKPVTKTETPAKKSEKPVIEPPTAASSEPANPKPAQSMALEPTTSTTSKPSVTVTMEDLIGPETKTDGKTEAPVLTMDMQTPVMTETPKENFILPSQPLVLAPEYLEASEAAKAAMEQGPAKVDLPTTMPSFAGTTPEVAMTGEEAPMLAANAQPTDVTLPPTVSSSDTLTGQDALIEKLKNKFFSGQRAPKPYLTEQGILAEQMKTGEVGSFGPPSPGSDMDREELLERIRQAALNNENLPANMLPSVPGGPVRAEVFYDDLGRRDPFEPLLKGLRSGFISEELPSVEALRMVGVLKDNEQALALMEDTDGHSYIMRPGDPVENGRVLSVGEARTVIQVDEYGWTRTVVLQLTSRGGDPSKTLGARSQSAEEEGGETNAEPIPE